MNDPVQLDAIAQELLLAEIADEFMERIGRGEQPEINEYVDRHPQIADILRHVLPALELMHPSSAAAEGGTDSPNDRQHAGRLGDYEIVREVGRGGMGVVYEARQLSLDRKVALKVLPFAAMLDQRQLRRFQNEARAAASLRHPNIVQVHFVGCERAVHFYAMDYIEGQTLADLIRHLRKMEGLEEETPECAREAISGLAEDLTSARIDASRANADFGPPFAADGYERTADATAETAVVPHAAISTERSNKSPAYFRSVAELGAQVAEALDHAHKNGVIHRDVKPSNVILDNGGKPWVTDFGLARIETDATLTVSGDLLGTVRYMSPEQALAKRILVDHRTDIYSLGATLYELLTLQPIFSGHDRQVLLRQIAFDEPRSPRKLNRAIPAELEIIVAKAMAKNPAERYDTAQELADDLRRFLEDRPIHARRPSVLQRTAKWSRRHKPLVAAACLLLALTTVGTTISAVLLAREQRNTIAALDDATEKGRALKVKNEELEKARRRAEENRRTAREAVDRLFTKVAEDLNGQPHMEQVRRELLEDALEFYQGFLRQKSDDPEIRLETAFAYDRAGKIYEMLGDADKSLEHYRNYHQLIRALREEYPSDPKYRELLARSHNQLTLALRGKNLHQEANRHYAQSLEEWQKLADDFPANPLYRKNVAAWYIGDCGAVGMTWGAISEREYEARLRKALELLEKLHTDFPSYPEQKPLLIAANNRLGDLLFRTYRLEEAQQHYDEAWAAKGWKPPAPRSSSGVYLVDDLPKAEKQLRNEIAELKEACDRFPDVDSNAKRLANTWEYLSDVLLAMDRFEEAEIAQSQTLEITKKWSARFPEVPCWQKDFAWANYQSANLLYICGKRQEAADLYRVAFRTFKELAEKYPDVAKHQDHYSFVLAACPAEEFRDPALALRFGRRALQLSPESPNLWAAMGAIQYRAGDFRGAIESLEKSRSLAGGEIHAAYTLVLAMAHWKTGAVERGRELYAQHLVEIAENPELGKSVEYRVFRAQADQTFSAPGADFTEDEPHPEPAASTGGNAGRSAD